MEFNKNNLILCNMNDYKIILLVSIAGLATILGNVVVLFKFKNRGGIISFSLGMAFVVMFLISIIELIPNALLLSKDNIIYKFFLPLFLLLIGYGLVILFDSNIKEGSSLYKVGILSMISLLIHNIPEGIICAMSSIKDIDLGVKMTLVIMLHNIPEGICISLPIYYSTGSRGKAFLYSLICGLGEIVGALFTLLFLKKYINNFILYVIYLITAGIMITLSTKKIMLEGLSYKKYLNFILGIIVGIVILVITL